MSASEPPGDPNAWDPDDTSAVPVGPEPEPTGAGGAGGAGGWGTTRVEPFAIAALVWAGVSILLPVIGTIVAFVLAARAADLIRRSRGERTGMQYVTAARIVAGAVLALWIIGVIAFLALRDDGSSSNHVAVPTQPPTTLVPITTSTTAPATTTTTKPPATTSTLPPPTISVIPPPPTAAPTTVTPTTIAPPPTTATTLPVTTTKPVTPTTTTPEQAAAKVQAKALQTIKASNRGLPDDERVAVDYTPRSDLLVTWAINNGAVGEHPTGTPTCTSPPTTSSTTTSSSTSSTTSTTAPGETTTSTTLPVQRDTQQQARWEAQQLLKSIKPQIKTLHLDVTGIQLVGTYPLEGAAEDDVVQALYGKSPSIPSNYLKMFDVPPAEVVQCLDPAFEL